MAAAKSSNLIFNRNVWKRKVLEWPRPLSLGRYFDGILVSEDLVVKFVSLVVKMEHLVVILSDLVVKNTGLVVIVKLWNENQGCHQ